MFRFIHAADIHLDSPLKGLAAFDDAPVDDIRSATRRAFENLVDLAIREEVRFVLIAGDLWDGDWPDAGTGLFFIRQAKRLGEQNIPIYVVKGNHDAENTITRELKYPENVRIFGHTKPESVSPPGVEVSIHAQSFREANIPGDLTASYPAPVAGHFNIGLLHTCLDGDARHYAYAPVSAEQLASKGYQYWALGHIHQRRAMERSGVPIVFPGNLQGRFIPEIGPKGCDVVSVDDNGQITSRFEPVDVVRWLEIAVDVSGATTQEEVDTGVIEHLRQARREHAGRLLAVRLRLQGETELSANLHRREGLRDRFTGLAIEVGDIWLERILPETLPPTESVGSPLAEDIRELLAEVEGDENRVRAWMEQFSTLAAELRDFEDDEVVQALQKPAVFRGWIRRAGAICLAEEDRAK